MSTGMNTGLKIALTALALGNATVAEAARSGCIRPADAEALIVTLMPDVLGAVSRQCEATLPQTAMLRSGATALATRWKSEGAGLEPGAAAAVAIFMSDDLKGGDPVAMLSLVRTALVNGLVGGLKPTSCVDIDRAVTLAAPLPARNIAGLFVMLAEAGGAGRKGGDLPICKGVKP